MLHKKRIEYQPYIDMKDKRNIAISRIEHFQNKNENNKNILAFSGGKDSLAAYLVVLESGIPFIPIYSATSADPPDLIYYLWKFNDWCLINGFPQVIIQPYNKFTERQAKGKMTGKEKTMWTLIGNRGIPPTRRKAYCCQELKERTGEPGDTVFTGVRWEESPKRSMQKMVNFFSNKIMVRPIVDWTEDEVWSFILYHEYKAPYCCLYDLGWDRIGCIGCPKARKKQRLKELEYYPQYKEMYIKAFNKMIKYRKENNLGINENWATGKDVFNWWLELTDNEIEEQCSIF